MGFMKLSTAWVHECLDRAEGWLLCGEEESHETAGVKSWQETAVVLAEEGKSFGRDTVCGTQRSQQAPPGREIRASFQGTSAAIGNGKGLGARTPDWQDVSE